MIAQMRLTIACDSGATLHVRSLLLRLGRNGGYQSHERQNKHEDGEMGKHVVGKKFGFGLGCYLYQNTDFKSSGGRYEEDCPYVGVGQIF